MNDFGYVLFGYVLVLYFGYVNEIIQAAKQVKMRRLIWRLEDGNLKLETRLDIVLVLFFIDIVIRLCMPNMVLSCFG